LVGLVSIAVALAGVSFAAWLMHARLGTVVPSALGRGALVVPSRREVGPIEQTLAEGARFGLDLRARQRRELDRWGWVDRRAGVATIPIARAMDVVVRENGR
jgi:hypothetical protein